MIYNVIMDLPYYCFKRRLCECSRACMFLLYFFLVGGGEQHFSIFLLLYASNQLSMGIFY